MQLSNADALSSYLFGAGKDARKRLPVGGRFEGEVVGGAAAQLRALVAEHGAWLAANCARQVSSYRCGPWPLYPGPQQLRALVAERGAWLAANCARQVPSYLLFRAT